MSGNQSLWSKCGVVTVDHVAVTTDDIYLTTKDYLFLPGSELLRGPGYNSSQNVDYAFVKLSSGMVIEVLGAKEGSPINGHLTNGGGAYHLCFTVNDLDYAIDVATSHGARIVIEPLEDEAFDGRRVAFLTHKVHGLFEFVEAYPESFLATQNISNQEVLSVGPAPTGNDKSQEVRSVVINAFESIFPDLDSMTLIANAAYGETDKWDSLKHLQLIMEIEKLTGISITADEVPSVKSFDDALNLVQKKLANK